MLQKEKQLNTKQIYKGKVVELVEDEVQCFNGQISKREIVKHHGGVCILALVNQKILIEKQYRYAYDEIIYELPAGKLEKDENPMDAAIRELEEETGYKANELINLGEMYPTCGYSNEKIYLFLAKNLTKTQTNFDEDEQIELFTLSIEEINHLIITNQIKDAKTICLIHKYLLFLNQQKQ